MIKHIYPGRPTIIEEKAPQVIENVEKGMGLVEACIKADLSYQTVRNWRKRGEGGEKPYAGFLRDLNCAKRHARAQASSLEFKFGGNTVKVDCPRDSLLNIGKIKGEDGKVHGLILIPHTEQMNIDTAAIEKALNLAMSISA